MDYLETFALIAKMASVWALFAIAAVEDLEIQQMNIITIFLGENLEEEIFMEQSIEFVIENENMICLLNKSLYELKQLAHL